jgi:hypothetical protein
MNPLSQMAAVGQMPVAPGQSASPDQTRLAALVPQPQLPQVAPSNNPIAQAYFDRLDNDYLGLVAQYTQHPESEGGKIINTDIAREMSPEYQADRTKSADVHEPSSAFMKKLYADKLSKPTPKGKDNTVVFTAGGTGAGKTTALQASRQVSEGVRNAEMVYDTNMNSFDSADKKIRQALDGNRKVSIIYTYRDPVEALTGGALKRASRQELDMGTGRTVPLSEHAKTHIGARQTVEQLQDKYKDHPKVKIQVIDNSRGPGKAMLSSLDKLPKLDENAIRKGLQDALEQANRTGAISPATYRGTADYAR